MTQPDLSSLALPDSPELTAEINQRIREYADAVMGYVESNRIPYNVERGVAAQEKRQQAIESLRSVITQHLLTAEEAKALLAVRCGFGDAAFVHLDTFASAVKSLRRLSGSSRGEE